MTQQPKNGFPKARSADLITETIGDEIVAYDGLTQEAHCLGTLASAVFLAADGKTSTADLAAIVSTKLNEPVDVPQIEQALEELEARNLILSTDSHGISRRQLMRKGAAVGGAAVAASLVTSVVTPAYGATGSVFNDSFSTLGLVVYDCKTNTYYYMKWDKTGLTKSPLCGISNKIGGCGYLPAPPSGGSEAGCLPGTSIQLDYGNGSTNPPTALTVTWPDGADYKVYKWLVWCGTTRCHSGDANTNGASSGTLSDGNGYLTLPITTYCG